MGFDSPLLRPHFDSQNGALTVPKYSESDLKRGREGKREDPVLNQVIKLVEPDKLSTDHIADSLEEQSILREWKRLRLSQAFCI